MPDLPKAAFLPLFLALFGLGTFFAYGIWERESERTGTLRLTGGSAALSASVSGAMGEGAGHFVSSRTGSVYYLPDCAGAKRIKDENRIWFMSREDAEARGLRPAKSCEGL